jgi:hypothetical protein
MLFISYFVFIFISAYITIYVGWICYKNGIHYVMELFDHNESIAKSINQLLLIGYYLINLGFILYALSCWSKIDTILDMILILSDKVSTVLISLCFLHFQNIIIIYLIRKYQNNSIIKILTP